MKALNVEIAPVTNMPVTWAGGRRLSIVWNDVFVDKKRRVEGYMDRYYLLPADNEVPTVQNLLEKVNHDPGDIESLMGGKLFIAFLAGIVNQRFAPKLLVGLVDRNSFVEPSENQPVFDLDGNFVSSAVCFDSERQAKDVASFMRTRLGN